VTAFSALAQGADTLFAEAAVSLHIPLHIITPFRNYETDFSGAYRNRYRLMKSKAVAEITSSYYRKKRRCICTRNAKHYL
jgi:hypothetical protein